jgi:hypothetical protein
MKITGSIQSPKSKNVVSPEFIVYKRNEVYEENKDYGSSERWEPSNLIDIAGCSDTDLLFGSDKDDVFNQLADMHPESEPLLCRVQKMEWCEGIKVHITPVLVVPKTIDNADDFIKEVENLVKRVGRVAYDQVFLGFDRFKDYSRDVFARYVDGQNCLIHDPKDAKKRRSAAQSKKRRKPVALHAFASVTTSAKWKLPDCDLAFKYLGDYVGTVIQMQAIVVLFNAVYGKNAHRKLAKWSILMEEWKLRRDTTIKKLGGWKGTQSFVEWLDNESKAKKVPESKMYQSYSSMNDNFSFLPTVYKED